MKVLKSGAGWNNGSIEVITLDYCLIPSKRESAFCLVALVLCVFVFLIWVVITEAFPGIIAALFVLFILFWLAMLLVSIANLIVQNRKYAVDERGITICSLGNRCTLYPWQSFRDVGICKVHYTSRLPYEYDVVIRLSRMEEPRGPKSGAWGPWTTELYELVHFQEIILITFTQERLAQLEAVSPNRITDYRSIRKNTFDIS